MRAPNDASLDEDALRLWIRTLDVRTISLIVVGVISFFLPTVREHRVLIAAMLFGGVIPYNAILAARVRRRGRLDVFMPVTDLLGAAVMAAVVPATWPAVVAVSVADIGFSVVMFGRRTALVSTAAGAAILAAAATRVPGGGSTGVSGFVTAAAIVIFTVGTVNTREKELRRKYRTVAIELQQYADIVEEIQFSLMVSRLEDPDDDRSVTAVRLNPAACRLFSLSADDALGQRVVDIWPNVEGERFSTIIAATIRSGEKRTIRDVPFHRADGSEGFFTVRIFPLPDNCAGLASDDITDQHLAADALRHQALHDSLTGLPNRALLQDRLATALAGAQRTQQSVALLVMDLNQFKEINDTLGHPMGDRMLEQVGVRLAVLLRDCDTVARLGGDEFAVLLTVDASRRGAEGVAVRIRDALTEPFDLMGVAVQTAASIGIVLSPEDGADVDTLLQRADIAMYNAKRSGLGYAFYVS
ncbi:MAG: hypothetical protein QOF40_685, partial [Actinomycetota bacterium]|nr:hypothetical protein [Actinomycetota bacterium]